MTTNQTSRLEELRQKYLDHLMLAVIGICLLLIGGMAFFPVRDRKDGELLFGGFLNWNHTLGAVLFCLVLETAHQLWLHVKARVAVDAILWKARNKPIDEAVNQHRSCAARKAA